jgi:invasion protein IalB
MRSFVIAAAGALSLAALLAAGPASADTRQVQDWKVTCNGQGCAAHFDGQGVQMVVGRTAEDGSRRIALRVSPSSAQGEPVAIRLDSGWQAGLVVAGCTETACQAAVSRDNQAAVEQAFSRARGGTVAYKAGDRIVIAPISLMGFSAASDMVR